MYAAGSLGLIRGSEAIPPMAASRPLQKSSGLRYHMHFDIYGNNLIEIWEYEGERKGRCICKVKEDTEIACYQRAIEMLESYSGKETVRHEKRAG